MSVFIIETGESTTVFRAGWVDLNVMEWDAERFMVQLLLQRHSWRLGECTEEQRASILAACTDGKWVEALQEIREADGFQSITIDEYSVDTERDMDTNALAKYAGRFTP